LHDKSEVQKTFKKFTKRAQNEFDVKIKKVRSDNGSEFKNTNIEECLDEEGIAHLFLVPYTPQQNGIVERKNRTLFEVTRIMLDEYKTSDQFCAEAVNTACHAINHLYLHKILQKTAYEVLTGKKPNVYYFRVFGSKCFIFNEKPQNSKFASKVEEGFLLGYASNAHGYRISNNSSGCVEIACDVIFDESNDSQKEQVDLNDVEDELAPQQAIKNLATGEIWPREKNDQETPKDGPNTAAKNSRDSRQICGESASSGDSGHISGNSGDAYEDILDQDKADEDDNPVQHQVKQLTQEFTKACNTIIQWITSLGAFKEG
jgi:hypothetical protein